jgi:hypothetical protein
MMRDVLIDDLEVGSGSRRRSVGVTNSLDDGCQDVGGHRYIIQVDGLVGWIMGKVSMVHGVPSTSNHSLFRKVLVQ